MIRFLSFLIQFSIRFILIPSLNLPLLPNLIIFKITISIDSFLLFGFLTTGHEISIKMLVITLKINQKCNCNRYLRTCRKEKQFWLHSTIDLIFANILRGNSHNFLNKMIFSTAIKETDYVGMVMFGDDVHNTDQRN